MSHLNVEIKSTCKNPNVIREILKERGADFVGVDHQIDTYFKTSHGRLKLRAGNIENTLIFYKRKNISGPKDSFVKLEKLSRNNNIKEILSASNEVLVEVDKKREIAFIDNIKFHIDEVKSLGSFVEIEAIDISGDIGREMLLKQCNEFIELFGITDEDFINCSYSDLLLLKSNQFYRGFCNDAEVFLNELFDDVEKINLDVENYLCDHICYRVESVKDYYIMKKSLLSCGSLLVESRVGGRKISTYKLHIPIEYKDRKIDIVELPEPKEGSHYKNGFEHVEFVINKEFNIFVEEYKDLEFDFKGTKKNVNPELRLKLNDNKSIKFHHQTLEVVIETELNQ